LRIWENPVKNLVAGKMPAKVRARTAGGTVCGRLHFSICRCDGQAVDLIGGHGTEEFAGGLTNQFLAAEQRTAVAHGATVGKVRRNIQPRNGAKEEPCDFSVAPAGA
jgi:hypothetical protein